MEWLEQSGVQSPQTPLYIAYLVSLRVSDALLPAWSAMVADGASGLLFLREARCGAQWRFDPETSIWTVFTTAGDLLGRFSLPPSTALLSARGGRLLAVRRDALGVEHGQLFQLPWLLLP